MWMKVHICSVKAKSEAGNIMSQRYNGNIQRPKPHLRNVLIFPENSAEGFGSRREHYWHYVVCIFENAPRNLVVQGRVQLEHNRQHLHTLISDVYWKKRPNQWAHLELCYRNPDILERLLNWIALSNSTLGKFAPMQVIKQPEHGRTKDQKWSSK